MEKAIIALLAVADSCCLEIRALGDGKRVEAMGPTGTIVGNKGEEAE